MEQQLTARDLLCMAGGVAYMRGLYSAIEGLAGRPRVRGNILLGRVFWMDTYRTRLQMVPPFENRCSCPKGGACRHVVTLGLTFLLHQLIGLVGKTNSGLVDLESRMNQRIDGLEQRLDHIIEGHHRDVTILKSESDHLARKVGVL